VSKNVDEIVAIEVGDVVVLNSGGPNMTVVYKRTRFGDEGGGEPIRMMVTCSWVGDNGDLHSTELDARTVQFVGKSEVVRG
jgi:uncharacterized protein YodC (DUF2158 family)